MFLHSVQISFSHLEIASNVKRMSNFVCLYFSVLFGKSNVCLEVLSEIQFKDLLPCSHLQNIMVLPPIILANFPQGF